MPHQKNTLQITAGFGDMLEDPSHRKRAIRQKIGVTHLRIKAIIRQHRNKAFGREGGAHKTIIHAFTAVPVAAVKKHNDRRRGCNICRKINIKLMSYLRAVRDSSINAMIA